MMAELMGRATGVCKGKGGSMHLSEPSVGLISTNAIVAGHIPMAGGAALSCQFRKTGPGRALLLRRRRLVRGRVLRGDEHGDAVEGATRLHLREQRARDLGADLEEPGDARHRRPGARLRHACRDRRRQRRARRADGRRRRRGAGPRRRGGPTFVECKTVRWERHSAFSAGGADPTRTAACAGSESTRSRGSGSRCVAWDVANDERPRFAR